VTWGKDETRTRRQGLAGRTVKRDPKMNDMNGTRPTVTQCPDSDTQSTKQLNGVTGTDEKNIYRREKYTDEKNIRTRKPQARLPYPDLTFRRIELRTDSQIVGVLMTQ
jgi:hypothetical protein